MTWVKSVKDDFGFENNDDCEALAGRLAGYWSEKRSDVNDILIEHLWSLSIAERARLANLEFADSLETEKVSSMKRL